MSLPEVRLTRQRIESCKRKPVQMFLKAEYLFGSRAIEVAGELTSNDRLISGLTIPYGPKGTDVWLAETDPPDPTWLQVLEILLKIQQKEASVPEAMAEAKRKVPVAVFKIKIAKQHVEKGEEIPYRLVALPLVDEYEPWAKEMFTYFKMADTNYVFPFNRQDVWDYITRKQRIFEGLTYRIKKYVHCNKKPELITIEQLKETNHDVLEKLLATPANNMGIVVFQAERYEYRLEPSGKLTRKENYTIFSHPKPLKNHGLRHIRTNELLTDYYFDGMDLAAMIGWSLKTSQKVSASPDQTGTYAEIREMWRRYIKKLCKRNLCIC